MSDLTDSTTTDDGAPSGGDGGDNGAQDSSTFRKLGRERDEYKDKATRLETENALLRAGVPLDDTLGDMFAQTYKGELTTDAIKAAWAPIADRLTQPGDSTPPPADVQQTTTPPADQQTGTDTSSVDDLMAAGDGPPSGDRHGPEDPQHRGLVAYHEARTRGVPHQLAVDEYMDVMIGAAMGDNPDPRALTSRLGSPGV